MSGKLVKTISQQTNLSGSSSLSRDVIWDGRDEYGDRLAKGVYVYKLRVRSLQTNKKGTPVVITLLSFGLGTIWVSVCAINSELNNNSNVKNIIGYLI